MINQAFVIERTYPAPIDKVWEAITEKDQMKLWYFDLPDFKPEVGLEFQFWGGPAEDRQYLHLCKITEVIQGKRLAYSWKYDGYEGGTQVIFELYKEENQTKLKLTHVGLETFPTSNPDFSKENFAEGWTWIIGTALKQYLEKTNHT